MIFCFVSLKECYCLDIAFHADIKIAIKCTVHIHSLVIQFIELNISIWRYSIKVHSINLDRNGMHSCNMLMNKESLLSPYVSHFINMLFFINRFWRTIVSTHAKIGYSMAIICLYKKWQEKRPPECNSYLDLVQINLSLFNLLKKIKTKSI